VKLRWSPTRLSPPFDTSPRKYTVETWEPVRREWKPVARGIRDTTYQIRELPKLPDHLFRVRMETEEASLSEPSLPVSFSRYSKFNFINKCLNECLNTVFLGKKKKIIIMYNVYIAFFSSIE
jgi:hypothetical protein